MKSKKIYTKLLLAGSLVLTSASLSSCDDFLTILPTDQIPEENFWQDKADLENVRAGAYQLLAQGGQTSKILLWGEVRADNLSVNDMSQTNLSYLQDAVLQPSLNMFDWSGFYTGINYCNLVIEQGEAMTRPNEEVDPSFTRADYRAIRAEMLALRSLYYFYLVKSYRDVPYITSSIRTDAQASKEKPAATSGVAILGACIDSLEANMAFAVENYGSEAKNKGQFTKLSVHALLADMYLCRACMLKNFTAKGNTLYANVNMANKGQVNLSDVRKTDEQGVAIDGYLTADGQEITDSYCNTLASQCLQKSIEHADWVINKIKAEYDEDLSNNNSVVSQEELNQPYPLYLNQKSGLGISDMPYLYNFGAQNSRESVLELQYNGTNTTNSTVNTYFSVFQNGSLNAKYLAISSNLIGSATSVNPDAGFGKTDFRLFETCNYFSKEAKKPISKFVVTGLSFMDIKDLTTNSTGSTPFTSYRLSDSNDAHWPIYRLADMMLIKAEAIARTGTTDRNTLQEGYRLVNQLFKRNNPALVGPNDPIASSTDEELICDRVDDKYGVNADGNFEKTAADLLVLTYRERQREFVCEGKRWFDLVRQAEFSNDTKTTLNTYAAVKSSVRTRLSDLWGFYIPIYNEELKVNGIENGGNLYQNPVWDRYTKN